MLRTTTLQHLEEKLSKFYQKFMLEKDIDLSRAVFQDPKHHPDYHLDIGSFHNNRHFKLKEKIVIAILSWFCSEGIRYSLNLWLEANWGAERKEVKEILLHSKQSALGWLFIQEDFNDNDFFGNYLRKEAITPFLKLKMKVEVRRKNIKRYSGWCRGPKDQSSVVDNLHKRVNYRESEEEYTSRIIEELTFQHTIENLFEKIEKFYSQC